MPGAPSARARTLATVVRRFRAGIRPRSTRHQPVAGAPGEAGSLRSRFWDELVAGPRLALRDASTPVPEPRAQRVGFARSASDGQWVAKRELDAGAQGSGYPRPVSCARLRAAARRNTPTPRDRGRRAPLTRQRPPSHRRDAMPRVSGAHRARNAAEPRTGRVALAAVAAPIRTPGCAKPR